jgi:hypothetical protein
MNKGIFFVTLRQQKCVEMISFNALFLCLGKKWSLFGHFDPKTKKNNRAPAAEIFNSRGAFCG